MYLKWLLYDIQMHFFIICSTSAKLYDKSLRNIGGRDAAPGEFPYVLKMDLKIKGEQGIYYHHLCTCSLLKPTWSLTSGHCIVTLLKLMSQSSSITGIIKYNISLHHEAPYSNILSTAVHPNIQNRAELTRARNDVGLIKSEKVVVNSFVKLSAVDYLSLYGNKVLSLGYGITKSSSGVYNDAYSLKKPLQVLDLIITKCLVGIRVYPELCSGGPCGKWSTNCPGDSGGPLMHESGLVGISTALDFWHCDEKSALKSKLMTNPGKFTPISPYIEWIVKIIN